MGSKVKMEYFLQDRWLENMQRARQRYEDAMAERRKCFQFTALLPPYDAKMKYQPIVPEHLDRRITWLKAWLDYGQELGEKHLFTVAVKSTAHHPRRM